MSIVQVEYEEKDVDRGQVHRESRLRLHERWNEAEFGFLNVILVLKKQSDGVRSRRS